MLRLPFDPSTDYYGLLGVSAEATEEQIRRAYRRLAKAFHPDLNAGSRVAQARMARINRAKEILLDPDVRAEYDYARRHRRAVAVAAVSAPPGRHAEWSAPASPNYRHSVTPPTVGARAAAVRTAKGGLDRTTVMMGLLVVPLLLALVLYVVDAVQVASRPLPRAMDIPLAPSPRTNPTAVARAAYTMVHGQPPSRYAGQAAYNVTHTFADFSPEAQTLRQVGRVLRDAGTSGDVEQWDRAVAVLCAMAGQC